MRRGRCRPSRRCRPSGKCRRGPGKGGAGWRAPPGYLPAGQRQLGRRRGAAPARSPSAACGQVEHGRQRGGTPAAALACHRCTPAQLTAAHAVAAGQASLRAPATPVSRLHIRRLFSMLMSTPKGASSASVLKGSCCHSSAGGAWGRGKQQARGARRFWSDEAPRAYRVHR